MVIQSIHETNKPAQPTRGTKSLSNPLQAVKDEENQNKVELGSVPTNNVFINYSINLC